MGFRVSGQASLETPKPWTLAETPNRVPRRLKTKDIFNTFEGLRAVKASVASGFRFDPGLGFTI